MRSSTGLGNQFVSSAACTMLVLSAAFQRYLIAHLLKYQFLIDTHATEIQKVLSVWRMFDDPSGGSSRNDRGMVGERDNLLRCLAHPPLGDDEKADAHGAPQGPADGAAPEARPPQTAAPWRRNQRSHGTSNRSV